MCFNERGCVLASCYEFQQEDKQLLFEPFAAYAAAVTAPSNSYDFKKQAFQRCFDKLDKALLIFTHFGGMMIFSRRFFYQVPIILRAKSTRALGLNTRLSE